MPVQPSGDKDATTRARVGGHVAFALAALALLAVHAWLSSYFLEPALLLGSDPVYVLDFDTHIAQTWRVLEGLSGWGRSWVYDVQLLAGQPAGVIFDADNKAWELWTYALWSTGLFSKGAAFNSFVILAHALVVPVVYGCARAFGLGRWAALGAGAGASMVWFFDSFAHWCWVVGMVSYCFAAYLSLVPLACFYRLLQTWRWRHGVGAALSLALVHLVHPYSFMILAPPMLAMYLAAARGLSRRQHAAVVGVAAFVLLVNAYWLLNALRFWHYILDSAYFGQTGAEFLLADIAALVLDPMTSGFVGTRTGVRLTALALALAGLALWRRDRDPRLRPFAVAITALFALSYFGSYSRLFAQIQPYRHVLPLAFVSLVPAAAFVGRALARSGSSGQRPRSPAWLLALALSVPLVQNFARDVHYFIHAWLPEVAPLPDGEKSVIEASGYVVQPDYRWSGFAQDESALDAWVRAHDDGQGRFLVEFPHLGEHLAWTTDAQVLGGFTLRNLQHSHANLFRRDRQGDVPDHLFRAYLETYAVRWIIVLRDGPLWRVRRATWLEPVKTLGFHTIYRVKQPSGLVARGGGRVTAATNRLEVRGSDPDKDVVLRFHWMETLTCAPECSLEREPIALGDDWRDEVGFLRVPAPHPADFTILNSY